MAKEKNSRNVRMPSKMFTALDEALTKRIEVKLISRKDASMVEGLRLVGRTPEWEIALNKLKTLPKKENRK